MIEFISQSHEILHVFGGVETIAEAARTCYQSEASGDGADERLVRNLIKRDHSAMLEFGWMTVRITCDRGISHEIVRHRLFSFAQESQRYVNSAKRGFEFILPDCADKHLSQMQHECICAAWTYHSLIEQGEAPEIARYVLPNATATRIEVGGNFREWRHFFALRTDSHAHPMMRRLASDILIDARKRVPVVFDDLGGADDGSGCVVRRDNDTHDDHHSGMQQVQEVGMNRVKVKLDQGAYMPERAHATDAGADIRTPYTVSIPPDGSVVIRTGIHIETPHGYATMIKSKSGLNAKHGIVAEGVIDEGFSGEILVTMYNHSPYPYTFEAGHKITQLVIVPVMYAEFEQVDEIGEGERGSNGHGSTGA